MHDQRSCAVACCRNRRPPVVNQPALAQWRNDAMDDATFDRIARTLGTAGTRRAALRTVAALSAAALGGRAIGASAQSVEPAGHKCKGKSCNKNKNCGHGLKCNKKGKCEYKGGNKGQKGDTCCGNNQCKNNLKCKHNKCKRK